MMEKEQYLNFYGAAYESLKVMEQRLIGLLEQYQNNSESSRWKGIEHYKSRIKSPDSMKEKLEKRGLPATAECALRSIDDAVGVRAVCTFADDIYRVSEWLQGQKELQTREVKDYIACPKGNGYRSYHIIFEFRDKALRGLAAEVQLRTIAQDFWASLEHQIKYKHNVRNEKLLYFELKRCADEIASVDVSMQTIRDLVSDEF